MSYISALHCGHALGYRGLLRCLLPAVPMWSRCRGKAFDVMITSSLQTKFMVAATSVDPFVDLAALRVAEKLKDRKHLQSCANEGIVFAPILWFLTLLAAGLLKLAM